MPSEALHSSDSPEWYTPAPIVEAARAVMGRIHLDPASHREANLVVNADRFYDEAEDGLSKQWHGSIFLNPPGGLVNEFWCKLWTEYEARHVVQAIWIGYSLEQLQTMQSLEGITPLAFPMCVTKRRIAFVENAAKKALRLQKIDEENITRASIGKKLRARNEKSSPSHGNYVTYIGPLIGRSRFRMHFEPFGKVINL